MSVLTDQRKLFVDEHIKLKCKNATQAAINAGYSPKSACSQASQILNDPKVAEYFEDRKNELKRDLQQQFFFEALDALKVMSNIMNNPDATDKDKIAVAKDFLDRAGFKPTDKIDVEGTIPVVISGADDLED